MSEPKETCRAVHVLCDSPISDCADYLRVLRKIVDEEELDGEDRAIAEALAIATSYALRSGESPALIPWFEGASPAAKELGRSSRPLLFASANASI